MPRGDWPQAVDARPPAQPEEGAISASSESRGADTGRTESPPLVSEKVQGKRVAIDELARKKRKTAGAAPRKSGGISIGGDPTTRTQSVAMSEWSDDDGAPTAPPLSNKAPLSSSRMEEHLNGGEGVLE